jgi:hypothetical protein
MKLRLIFGVFLLISIFSLVSSDSAKAATNNSFYGPSALYSGLMGWWTFDGSTLVTNVADSSGRANNGNLTNFPATTSAVVAGKIGQGLNFDGVDDYVSVTNQTDFNYDRTDSFTLSAWVYRRTSVTEDAIVGKNDSGFHGYTLWLPPDGGQCSGNGAGCASLSISGTATLSMNTPVNSVPLNVWTHIVATYSGTSIASGVKMYINGASQTLSTQAAPATGSALHSDPLRIGTDFPAQGDEFNGKIDDVRIYNRVLTPAEVAELYNTTSGGKVGASVVGPAGLNSGLMGWWTFDGANLTNNVTDSSGRGNNGTFVNLTPTTTYQTIGKLGQAFNFPGTDNNYVSITNQTDFNFERSSTFSISAWIKRDTSSTEDSIVGKNNSSFQGYTFWLPPDNDGGICASATGCIAVTVHSTSGDCSVGVARAITNGIWYHVVFTYTGSGSVAGQSIYINGVKQTTVTQTNGCSGGTAINTDAVTIGSDRDAAGSGDEFDGTIDDVRIYNRVLSQSEINQLYNIDSGGKVGASLVGPAGLNTGLMGWWTFDGNTMTTNIGDSSGRGNNGTLVGLTPTSTNLVSGKIGQAFKFPGTSNNYISVANQADFNFTVASTFSISAWINRRTSNTEDAIIGKNNSSFKGYAFWLAQDGIANDCPSSVDCIDANLFNSSNGGNASVYAPSAISKNKWHHVVMTYNGNNRVTGFKIYVDGVSQTLFAGQDSLVGSDSITNADPLVIGVDSDAITGDEFDGKIDDVRVYNRILSQAEVTQLYSLGK